MGRFRSVPTQGACSAKHQVQFLSSRWCTCAAKYYVHILITLTGARVDMYPNYSVG
jgi:hypothetical protein